MQIPAKAVARTALLEVVRISALPARDRDPYPGPAPARSQDLLTRSCATGTC